MSALESGNWWGAKLDLGEWGWLRCNKADSGPMWLWQFTPFAHSNGTVLSMCVLQGMRKTERGAKRAALIETQRYLGEKLKLLGNVKP